MDLQGPIKSQFYAALEMLKQAILKCPASRWNDREARKKFWQISYHALFYTHLYLQDSEKDFKPWIKHRDQNQILGQLPWPPHDNPKIGEPFSKGEILEFLEFCQKQVEDKVTDLNLEAESGFDWLPFSKLELQIYNIRHLQHHAAELIEWSGATESIEANWIGTKPDYLKYGNQPESPSA